jgi:hypothetical protein
MLDLPGVRDAMNRMRTEGETPETLTAAAGALMADPTVRASMMRMIIDPRSRGGMENLNRMVQKVKPLAEEIKQIEKLHAGLSKMVNNFVPLEFTDALITAWKGIAPKSSLTKIKKETVESLDGKLLDTLVRLDEIREQFRPLSLEIKEEMDRLPASMTFLTKEFLNIIPVTESDIFRERMMATLLLHQNGTKRLLPYLDEVADAPEAQRDHSDKAEVEKWFAAHDSLPAPGTIVDSEFLSMREKLQGLATVRNDMLEHQSRWETCIAEVRDDKTGNHDTLVKRMEEVGQAFNSSSDTLIGDALSFQAKYAHFSLLGKPAIDSKPGEQDADQHRQVQDIGNTLFQKSRRFTAGLQELLAIQNNHKNEEAVLRIRSFERRAKSLAGQYAGFASMLEESGLGEHVAAFRKLEERFNDAAGILRRELSKRGAEVLVAKVKKKPRTTTAEHQLRAQIKTEEARPAATVPSTEGEDDLAMADEDFDDLTVHSLLPPLSPLVLADIDARKKEVRQSFEQCKKSMASLREQLYVPLEDQIRAYLKKYTVEPHTTESLRQLDEQLRKVKRRKPAEQPQALLEYWGAGMVQQLVKGEVDRLSRHYALTELAMQQLAELKNLDQEARGDEGETLEAQIRDMKAQHKALELDIAENCIYPSEGTLDILLKHGVVSVELTDEGVPYYWRSPTGERGERGLIDVFEVRKKQGDKLWSDIHRHCDGNPDTKTPYLIDGKKNVTVINMKHPDVRMRGRDYERTTSRQGEPKTVHRTTMTQAGLQRAIEASRRS